MLRLCVVFAVLCCVKSSEKDVWPFELADKYVETFKSNIEELNSVAAAYSHHQIKDRASVVTEEEVEDQNRYDFIVIGGGTSGSVLASRLSEVPEWKVLLLEAGTVENKATKVPRNWEMLRNTHYNWGFTTAPQNYSCLAMLHHQCTIPAGRALGGTTAINSMVYTRGNHRDYDLWADLGNKGWCWADVLPYFNKIEDAHFEPFDKHHHHRGGPQHIQHPQHHTDLTQHVLEAAKELDLHVVDYNGKYQVGASVPQLTTKCGERYSTASAYLEPALKRDNLIIKPLSQVLKVLISTHTKEAKGVQYLHEGKIFNAKAKKEVILAAGAINTPKILILSGVGPKDECLKHHIDLVADLQVGKNLNIRPTFVGLDFIYKHHEEQKHEEKHIHQEEEKEEHQHQKEEEEEHHDAMIHDNEVMVNYLKHGKGPLTTPGTEAILFLKTKKSKDPISYPDVELQFVSKANSNYEDYSWMKLSKPHYDSIWKPLEHQHYVKLLVTLNHPHSKGIVKLHGLDPLLDPYVEPHFLADEDEIDYHTLLAGLIDAIKLTHTEAFSKTGLTLNHHAIHGCEGTDFGTEAYWECAIKYLVVPTEDASGTARMGPVTDAHAVVDNKLKVHGIHNLRVADASVIPVSISGNLVAASMMIGEKAASLIIEDWQEEH